MARTILSDEQWAILRDRLPLERSPHAGRPYIQSHRTTIEGILYIARVGAPWRDLPSEFGNWNSVYRRFRRWVSMGVFKGIAEEVSAMFQTQVLMVDGTFIRMHQHAAGALRHGLSLIESREANGIGYHRGGMLGTNVIALTDQIGRFVHFEARPGNMHESRTVMPLFDSMPKDISIATSEERGRLLADKAYDNNQLRDALRERGIEPVVPPRANRKKFKKKLRYDEVAYQARHIIENSFADIKHFRGIATRYHKLKESFEGLFILAAWYYNTRNGRRGPSPRAPYIKRRFRGPWVSLPAIEYPSVATRRSSVSNHAGKMDVPAVEIPAA